MSWLQEVQNSSQLEENITGLSVRGKDMSYPYGLELNPYSAAIPTPSFEVAKVLGGRQRRRIRDEILADLKVRKGEFRIITIQGRPQVGKTQLLLNIKYLTDRDRTLKRIKAAYLKMSTEDELNLLEYYKKLRGIRGIIPLSKKRYVMEIDEIDTVYREEIFWKSLKSLIDKRPKDLTLILAVTPEVLVGLESLSAPLASRIRNPHLLYDLSEPDLQEIVDIAIEYLSAFGVMLDEKGKKTFQEGLSFIYTSMKLRKLRDVLAVLWMVFECAKEREASKIDISDFKTAIERVRPDVPVEGSLTGLKQHEYLMALAKLPPTVPSREATEIVRKSIISFMKNARARGFINYAYPKSRQLSTPGGKRQYRIVDWFVETKDGKKIAGDVKMKEKDGDLVGDQELANVIDIAQYCKEVDRVIVVSNGTFPPIAIPKLTLLTVGKVFLADLVTVSEKLEVGETVPDETIKAILRELKIV
ncbi:MAG: hypothetical protein ACTSV7_08945 [Candidatus Baldrarchaeia archaeon]